MGKSLGPAAQRRMVHDAIERGKRMAFQQVLDWIDQQISETEAKRDDARIQADALRHACINSGIPITRT